VDSRFSEEDIMKKRRYTKLVHEGQYVAEVDVELIDMNTGWSPYLSLDDAYKLDDIRNALRQGDVKSAGNLLVFLLSHLSQYSNLPESKRINSD
jgi:hypothetical protein